MVRAFSDLSQLPIAVLVVFVVMLWPAIWAAAGIVIALTVDVRRLVRRHRDFEGQGAVTT